MLRAKAGDLLILGLDAENVRRLKAGLPIVVDLDELGGARRVALVYGETLADIARDLEREYGMKLPPAQPYIKPGGKPQ